MLFCKQHVAQRGTFSPPWGEGSRGPRWQAPCEGWDGGAMGTVLWGWREQNRFDCSRVPSATRYWGGGRHRQRFPRMGDVSERSGERAHPVPWAGGMGMKPQG